MKIIILDGSTIGADMDLSGIKKYGNITFYEKTAPEQTADRIKTADIVISNKVVIDKKELDTTQNLKLICVAATGYNNINIDEANKKDIVVANVKGYSTESVAQQAFAYILSFYNSTFEYQSDIKSNLWQQLPVFTTLKHKIFELSGKTMGIIGYGAIGKRVGEIAKVFGMKILIAKIPGRIYNDINHTELDFVLKNSDIISIHSPLSNLTKNLISKNELEMMKQDAILVNYARGGIVNEQDLFEILKQNKIKGAIVDVLSTEPPSNGNILFNAPNIFITPHTAWASVEARKRLVAGIVKNIELFLSNKNPQIRIIS